MDKETLLYHYFSNQLTPKEQEAFDALLETDSEFKEQFDFERSVQEVIRDHKSSDLKEKLKGFERDIDTDEKVVTLKPEGSFNSYKKWMIAASIALLMGLGYLGFDNLSGPNYNRLYEENFQNYPNTAYAITRGESDEDTLKREAFVAYETDNTNEAISLFKRLKQKEDSETVNFYLAQSYLQAKQTQEAITLLDEVILVNGEFKPQALWYKSLAHLKLKEKDKALQSLNKLVEDGRYKKTEATGLVKELD